MPVLLIIAFALAPYRLDGADLDQADRRHHALAAALSAERASRFEHYRELLGAHELRRQPPATASSSRCGAVAVGLGDQRAGRLRLLALSLSRTALADDAVPRHQHVPDRAADHPALRADAHARPARHLPRRHHRPLHLRHPVRHLDADQLLRTPSRANSTRRRRSTAPRGCRPSAW